jgi:acyl-CoA oxidase
LSEKFLQKSSIFFKRFDMDIQSAEIYTPSIRSFIPLLYVAWADGLLSPSEVSIIHARIRSLEHLSASEKDLLLQWSTPSKWPDDQVFRTWMQLLKEASKEMDYQSLDSIVELGIEMYDRSNSGLASTQERNLLVEALVTIQEEIELDGLTKFRALDVPQIKKYERKSTFEVKSLQQLLDGDTYELKDQLKKLLTDPQFATGTWRNKEDYRRVILNWLGMLAQRGYGALGFPEQYGGQNSIMQYAAVFEVLSYHDLSLAVKFGVQFGLFGGSIQNLGTAGHHMEFLEKIGKGECLGCFAMTETGHGSNVRDLETTAVYDSERDVILIHSPNREAGKEYIGNTFHAHWATVFAQLIVQGESKGVHAILVPMRDSNGELLPGISVEDCGYKMGLNGIDNGRIWFDQVVVPRTNLLNRFGSISNSGEYQSPIENPGKRFFTMLGTLVAGRICVGMGALSAAKASLTIAIKYGLNRRQFGSESSKQETLIIDYPAHQRRLMPKLSTAYALHFASSYLIDRYQTHEEEESREIETLAAAIKSYSTWFTNATIQECREACGAKGYLWENRIASYKADADIFATFEGDNTVLMQLVAKGLLSSFKEEFSGSGFLSAIRYLASQVNDSMISINPIYKRKTDAAHLNDFSFHHHAFEFRERKILFSLGSRMRNMFKKRITPYDAFLRSQTHMIELSKAFVEKVVLVQFQKVVEDNQKAAYASPLRNLYTLFALSTIEQNKGWFLEHDYLEGIKTKAIRRRVDRLCTSVRADARELVDAFGIPKGLLNAPIAEEKA